MESMRKSILLLGMLLTLFLISAVPFVQAARMGYQIKGTNSQEGSPFILYQKYDVDVPTGFNMDITNVTLYLKNDDVGANAAVALYDSDKRLITMSENIDIDGEAWYTIPLVCELTSSGEYFFGVALETNAFIYHNINVAGVEGFYDTTYDFVDPAPMASAWDENQLSLYVTYSYEYLGYDPSLTSMAYTIGLLGVIAVSLVLFKLKLGLVGIVWGIFGLAIAASLVGNQNIPFYPYLTLAVGMVGILLVFYSGYEMRGA